MKKPTKAPESKQPAVSGVASDPKAHTAQFSQAMKLFTSGEYAKAKDLFEKAARGPVLSVNESSLMYSRMCTKRLEKPKLELKTPEELYTYAVSLINSEKFRDAVPHLERAVASSGQSHYLYALALCLGRSGSVDAAADHLRRAVTQDASIRNVARSDSDFTPLLEHSALRELVTGDGGSSA
jgi:tetratricopeptide (TPR) repeat protein